MNWQIINIIICIATAAMALGMAIFASRRREIQGAGWFIGLVTTIGWVTSWYAFESAAGNDLSTYIAFSKFEYIGLTFIPLFWLGFALNFSGRERPLSKRWILILSLIPLITIALAFTNERHGLIWEQTSFDKNAFPPIFKATYGTWFWIYTVYAYGVFLIGSVVLVRRAFNTWRLYQEQAALIFLGTAMPWLSNLLEIFDVAVVPGLYLNAVFLGLAITAFAFALFRLRLLDLMPMAYDTILNNVPDGIIVVDNHERIVALNRYIKPYLRHSQRDPIGQRLQDALPNFAADIENLRGKFDYIGQKQIKDRVIEIRIAPVDNRKGQQRGRLFVLRDITPQVVVEQAQREQQLFAETMRDIGSTLNSTLDIHRVLSMILVSVEQLIVHSHANIMLVEADSYTTYVAQHRGYDPQAVQQLGQMRFDYRDFPLFVKAAQQIEPLLIPDTTVETEWRPVERIEDVKSFACAPIRVNNELVGFINIDGSKPHSLQANVVPRLQILAQQASIAINNARLYEQTRLQAAEEKRRADAFIITQQVYREIGFTLNINHLLEITLDATLRLSMADAGCIALMRNTILKSASAYGQYNTEELDNILIRQSGVVGQAANTHQPVLLLPPDVPVSALPNAKAQIALPIYGYEGQNTNILYGIILLETIHPQRFTQEQFQLLSLIADRFGAAIENTQLVDAVRARAAELELLYERVSRLEQLKGDMMRIAAHDLKNPLSVVLNYLTLLLESDYTLDTSEVYPAMHRAAQRMHQIIQDFLSLDRVEQIADQQTMQPFDLREIVSRAEEEFADRAKQKAQQLTFVFPDAECMVNGDKVQLYEALANFLSNAIKYTPEKGEIRVLLKSENDNVSLEVIDTGYGIPDAQQDQLFEPYYRANMEETAEIEGTGLGLSLTKKIIERHNGSIIFQSSYGRGSTFGFQLPLYRTIDLFNEEASV
jgi:signal transduction histidine kinase/PAS domain-containing protein